MKGIILAGDSGVSFYPKFLLCVLGETLPAH